MDFVASSNRRNKGKDKKKERKKHPYRSGGRERLREDTPQQENISKPTKKRKRK